ncbi:MAG: hypothetical protein NWF01_11255 [Candidatus Bathyarchaeota archaeon]|nr:hypothetical protein [Candidatus Bathyarchaeota archaeon]
MNMFKRTVTCSLILILTISILFSAINLASSSTGGTQVSGVLSSDTTWTQANSPYNLTDNILVDSGVILTLEPGVIVNLKNFYIMVNGTFQAIGAGSNPVELNMDASGQIIFTKFSVDWDEATDAGCKIENTIITSETDNIVIDISNSLKISDSTIYGSIRSLSGAEPTILNNNIFGQINLMLNSYAPKAVIQNNVISAGGVDVWIASGDCTLLLIEDNIIFGCSGLKFSGVLCQGTGNPIIRNNLLLDNTNGLTLSLDAITEELTLTITDNTIADNSNGIMFYGAGIAAVADIQYNNIFNNTDYNLKYDGSQNINLPNNWWGTTNTAIIDQSIYDFYDDYNIGKVIYTPFLDETNPQSPVIPFFTIVATAGNNGSITPNGSVSVKLGSDQTFTLTPNFGYHTDDVIIDGTTHLGAVDSFTLDNILADHTVAASFAINTYNITASAGAGGSISPSGNVSVTHGENQTFTVTPDTGYQIESVLIDGSPATAPYTFTNVTSGHTISATFQSTSSASPSPSPTPTIPEFTFPITILMLAMITLVTMVVLRTKSKTTLKL